MAVELIVDAADILRRAGVDESHLQDMQDAIEDAQADVEGHIGRKLLPEAVIRHGLIPDPRYPLTDNAAWPQIVADDDWSVFSAEPDPDLPGAYVVTFNVGLDARNEAPIKRFVRAHAIESMRNNPAIGDDIRQRLTGVSAEGQSLNFEKGSTAEGAAGALPNIKMLDRYRRPMAFRRPTPPARLWPYAY